MARVALQPRRGTATHHAAFTGLDGELTVNTDTKKIHVHDGSTLGGFPVDYTIRAERFGVVANGQTDVTAALQNAIRSLPQSGGTVFLPSGVCVISDTIVVPANARLIGEHGGQKAAGPLSKDVGTTLKWAGANDTTMVSIVNAQNVHLDGLNLDGGETAGVVGILIDATSSNSGPSGIILERFSIWDCAVAIQWGTTAATPAYQNDAITIRNFKIRNSKPGFGDGIVIDSNEAAQGSSISQGVFQTLRNGIDIKHAGGSFELVGLLFGSLTGTDIKIDQTADIVISTCHHEQGSKAIDVVGPNFTSGTLTFLNNRWFNQPVTVQRQCNIVSIGNAGHGTATCSVAGANIVSISDTFNNGDGWTITNGNILRLKALSSNITGTFTAKTGFSLDNTAGQIRGLAFKTKGANRWLVYCDEGAESGANNGSDFAIACYADNGRFLFSPVSIDRATGAVRLRGTQTNDDAGTGDVGEYVSDQKSHASRVEITNNTGQAIVQIALTAGDWDVSGFAGFVFTEAVVSGVQAAFTNTSGKLGVEHQRVSTLVNDSTLSAGIQIPVTVQRFSLRAPTVIYMNVHGSFSAGTVEAYGRIAARRVR